MAFRGPAAARALLRRTAAARPRAGDASSGLAATARASALGHPPSMPLRARAHAAAAAPIISAHAEALERAGAAAPLHLPELLEVLRAQGFLAIPPSQRAGLHPLVLPLAAEPPRAADAGGVVAGSSPDGDGGGDAGGAGEGVIGLLLRPMAAGAGTGKQPPPLPVVRSGPGGVDLIAFDATQYVYRALVEEDAAASTHSRVVSAAAGDAGRALYTPGSLAGSSMPARPVGPGIRSSSRHTMTFNSGNEGSNVSDDVARNMLTSARPCCPEVFVLKNVGNFPDDMEGLALGHEAKGDVLSALVTAEWYTNGPFKGWGRPRVFAARMLHRNGRADESRDAARIALAGSPWYTMGSSAGTAAEMAKMAGLTGVGPARYVPPRHPTQYDPSLYS